MPIQPIQSIDDPHLWTYRNMKDKELARQGGRFIAEGEMVVRRLLNANWKVESVLVAERKREAILPLVPENVPIYVASDEVIEQVIGFEFHSGVMACGIRPPSPALIQAIPPVLKTVRLTICQSITNTENLGSLIRVSAALGADAVVLGEHCCDPFFRQSVRVSMGSVFSLPIVRSVDLLSDLDRLKSDWQIELWAAVVGGKPEELSSLPQPARAGVLLGNETTGLDEATVARCDRAVTISMQRGTDSLNVAVAAAVFLYHLMRNSKGNI